MEKGYKVFNPDWTCLGFRYEIGKTFKEDVEPRICNRGFHYCPKLIDCFNYYDFNPNNKVAEIEAIGDIDGGEDENKHCTNKIKIVRELNWFEVLSMVNAGKDNTGLGNSGDYNSGDRNSGNYNSGNYNSGNCNSGYCNSGYCNSGDYNSGNYNSGYRNSGYRNSGYYNSGYCNSGNYNSGYCNSGWFNSGDYNSGLFNTDEPTLRLFNKSSDWHMKDFNNSDAYCILLGMPFTYSDFVSTDNMIEEEKEQNLTYETTDGFIKVFKATDDDRQKWWDNLSKREKEKVMALPNFDVDIFKQCTGITVNVSF